MVGSIAKAAERIRLLRGFIDLDLCLMKKRWHSREPWWPKHQGATLRSGGLTWIGHERRDITRQVTDGVAGVVSIAFIWILLPFYGAVFWAVILGILFAPLQRRLQLKFGWQRNVTSLLTLSVCLVIAILPVIILGALLVQEGAALYNRIEAASWTLQAM
jgi:hypothetical protein